jgi:hypothetical protein
MADAHHLSNSKIATYRDFWPYYLREHGKPATRRIHFFGTGLATASLVALVATGIGWFGLLALVGGYAPAWIGHFFIEKNRPATFTYPFWSLISDFRMAGLWAVGRLGPELVRAGLPSR